MSESRVAPFGVVELLPNMALVGRDLPAEVFFDNAIWGIAELSNTAVPKNEQNHRGMLTAPARRLGCIVGQLLHENARQPWIAFVDVAPPLRRPVAGDRDSAED